MNRLTNINSLLSAYKGTLYGFQKSLIREVNHSHDQCVACTETRNGNMVFFFFFQVNFIKSKSKHGPRKSTPKDKTSEDLTRRSPIQKEKEKKESFHLKRAKYIKIGQIKEKTKTDLPSAFTSADLEEEEIHNLEQRHQEGLLKAVAEDNLLNSLQQGLKHLMLP